MKYSDFTFKIPLETQDYKEMSTLAIKTIENILKETIDGGNNKIIINTNLKHGLPMENINKIAGPFVEAWAGEIFENIVIDENNKWNLIHAESRYRLDIADIILQFKRDTKINSVVTAYIDSKATSEDLPTSGKSPNITSFGRIRSAYIEDPDYLFIILSLKHKVFCKKNEVSGLQDGIMEVVRYNAYDLKYISTNDLNYNPSLGTGQIQIKDIHYVSLVDNRTTWEFCQLLDSKFLASSKKTIEDWYELAFRNSWIK